MSGQWMKANGMTDESTPAELDRRVKFAPHLGKPAPEEYRAAGRRTRWNWLMVRWTRLRIFFFGPSYLSRLPKARIDALSKVGMTTRERKFYGRWTPEYMRMLNRAPLGKRSTYAWVKTKKFIAGIITRNDEWKP